MADTNNTSIGRRSIQTVRCLIFFFFSFMFILEWEDYFMSTEDTCHDKRNRFELTKTDDIFSIDFR